MSTPIKFEKIVQAQPAYDKRSAVPSENYGICSMLMRFILKGPSGAVQFVLNTGWYPPHIQRERRAQNYDFDTRFNVIHPEGWDLGYHSYEQHYDGQDQMDCDILPSGHCYYDGSSLNARPIAEEFITKGTDWLWEELERYYNQTFNKEQP